MLNLSSRISWLILLTTLLTLYPEIQCQSTEPPPNVKKILKLAKTIQPDLCYSFCETCQSNKQEYYTCISCERPYMKSVPPICNISAPYSHEAWELWSTLINSTSGPPGPFQISPRWKTNSPEAKSQFCGSLILYGPFYGSNTLSFTKSIRPHDFVIIKFFFVQIDWSDHDSVLFHYSLANNATMRTVNLDYVGNGSANSTNPTAQTALCARDFSSDLINQNDMMSSITIRYFDRNTGSSTLSTDFQPKVGFSAKGSWGLNTFIVSTGTCYQNCFTCNYDSADTACLTCRNFLAQAANKSCSLCLDGFFYASDSQCKKCPIECLRCKYNESMKFSVECTACPEFMTLNNGSCNFSTNNYERAVLEANLDKFEVTYFYSSPSVSDLVTICGGYSLIGGLGVTTSDSTLLRTYPIINPHVSVRIRFNLLKIDRTQVSGKIRVQIDDTDMLYVTVPFTGTSNECGLSNVETMTTLESGWIGHTRETDVNLTFKAEFGGWGIRDIYLSTSNCGPNCADCSKTGCRACVGFIKLVGVSCEGCIAGFVANGSNCVACKSDCQTCELNSGNCTSCYDDYTLVRGQCVINPDIIALPEQLSAPVTASINPGSWMYHPPNSSQPSSNCSSVSVLATGNTTAGTKPTTFLVSQNYLSRTYTDLPAHYKVRVRFTLLKVDDWNADRLGLMLNDLMVMKNRFQAVDRGGSNLCAEPLQNQLLVRKDISIKDKNSTLKVDFEVFDRSVDMARYFGIRDWRVLLSVCERCDYQQFTYDADYTVDSQVHVFLRLNRPLRGFAFNLTFKEVFKVYLQNVNYDYQIEERTSRLYILNFAIKDELKEIIDGHIRVVCLYPTAVLTESDSQIINVKAENITLKSTALVKYLNNNQSEFIVRRYSKIQSKNPQKSRKAFEIISKIILYGGLLSFLFGWQIAFTGSVHNLQRLWLHMYIVANYIPPNFKIALSGLKIMQNLPFLPVSTQDAIKRGLSPKDLYLRSPVSIIQYFEDVEFAHNIYHVVIFGLVFLLVFCSLITIFNTSPWIKGSKAWILRYYRYITCRSYWLFDSLIYFQYITVIFAIFAQFLDASLNYKPCSELNLAASIIALLFSVCWPIAQIFYMRIRDFDPNFTYNYNEIHSWFYRDKAYYFTHPSQSIYQFWRWIETLWFVVLVVVINQPYVQLVLMIVTFLLHFVWIIWSKQYNEDFKLIYYMKLIELASFVAIEISMLICFSRYNTLDKSSYDSIGTAAIAFMFTITGCSIIRTVFGVYKKVMLLYDIPNPEFMMEPLSNMETSLRVKNP